MNVADKRWYQRDQRLLELVHRHTPLGNRCLAGLHAVGVELGGRHGIDIPRSRSPVLLNAEDSLDLAVVGWQGPP